MPGCTRKVLLQDGYSHDVGSMLPCEDIMPVKPACWLRAFLVEKLRPIHFQESGRREDSLTQALRKLQSDAERSEAGAQKAAQ